jgi:hypothetical protein
VRFEKDSFGATLRAGRERRKVPIAQLVEATKANPEIWRALEDNDLSRWPTRIYARSLIRQYAEHVGLDPEELVNEFCRLFPHGDRRSETLLRDQASLIGHRLVWQGELPRTETHDRRADGTLEPLPSRGLQRMRAGWLLAAALDCSLVLAASGTLAVAFRMDGWRSLGLCAVVCHTDRGGHDRSDGGRLHRRLARAAGAGAQPITRLLARVLDREFPGPA